MYAAPNKINITHVVTSPRRYEVGGEDR